MDKIKNLNILIKIKNKTLQDQYHKIKKLTNGLGAANKMIEQLKYELHQESQWINENNNYLNFFSFFSNGIHQKLNKLYEQKKILEENIDKNIDILQKYFLEKKRLEVILSKKLEKLKIESFQKEEKILNSLIMDRMINDFIVNRLQK